MSIFSTDTESYGLPPDAFDERPPPDESVDRPYIDELAQNPAWKALEERLIDDAAGMIQKLIGTRQRDDQTFESFALDLVTQIGEIRGALRVLEEPVTIRRAIADRRDR